MGRITVLAIAAIMYSQTAAQPGHKPPDRHMVRIPASVFEMGTDLSQIPELEKIFSINRDEVFKSETPRHSVKIGDFFLDRYEVTNADFHRFVKKQPEWQKARIDPTVSNGRYLEDWKGNDPPPGKKKHPVVFVTWHSAVAYCRSLGKRLPTEAEWEFAARGGLRDAAFPWGSEPADTSRANYGRSGIRSAAKVGSYPANGYGLFDMAGNVWEFLADEWANYGTGLGTQNDPVGGGDRFMTDSYRQVRTRRVIRGGSYGASPVNLRVTYRDSHSPENARDHVGFRCAADINGKTTFKK
ncbi:MAG: formylglycine-generating enzyme family protein [Acidobacteriota bacterium]